MSKNLSSILRGTNYGTLPISSGGTNATTAVAALTSLGAQPLLISGTNLKTINGGSILGTGDITVAASNYVLPTASTTALGGVKVDGTSISITNGIISTIGNGSKVAKMNFLGTLTTIDSDLAFVPEQNITITGITANLTQSPTVAGSFSLKKNGIIVATVAIPTNQLILSITTVSITGTHADSFTVSLTATSGKNLTITLIYG
jgi:hypothetical protein